MNGLSVSEKIRILKNVDLFSKLEIDELTIVAQYSSLAAYKRGTALFNVNDASISMFIVMDGEVLVTRHLENDNDVYLAQYTSGDSFGELDLFENATYAATAVTIKDTVLLVFPSDGMKLDTVLQNYPRISARILYKLIAMVSTRLRQTHSLIREKSPWIAGLKRQLFTDKLTGLFNEKFLLEEFGLELPRYGDSTCLLMIKPDNFKEINDNYGHEAGDRILLLISIFIQSVMRTSDIGIRYKGDEFAAILPWTTLDEAVQCAQEIGNSLYDIDLNDITEGGDIRIRVSIGIAAYPLNSRNSRALISLAHANMMKARDRGGNRISISRRALTEI